MAAWEGQQLGVCTALAQPRLHRQQWTPQGRPVSETMTSGSLVADTGWGEARVKWAAGALGTRQLSQHKAPAHVTSVTVLTVWGEGRRSQRSQSCTLGFGASLRGWALNIPITLSHPHVLKPPCDKPASLLGEHPARLSNRRCLTWNGRSPLK